MIILLAILLLLPSVCHANTRDGLVGWWKLDEGTGTTAFDSSWKGNLGTINSHQTWKSNCPTFKCLSFDGVADNITTGNVLGLADLPISVSCWVYLSSASLKGAFIKIGSATTGVGFGIGGSDHTFDTSGNEILALFENVIWKPSGANAGTGWHHLVAVMNTDHSVKFYNNAVNVATTSAGGSGIVAPATQTSIGGYTSGIPSNRFFNGLLDDMRVYNRSLTAQEVIDLFKSGVRMGYVPGT